MIKDIKWIHFSDIHMNCKDDMETSELRRQLILFLKKNNIFCDYAFCTGDIRDATKTYDGADVYVKEICEAVNVSLNNLFIVPGNHDVNRDCPLRDSSIKEISFNDVQNHEHLGTYDSNNGIIEPKLLDTISSGLQEFRVFLSKIYDEDRIKLYSDSNHPHFTIQTDCFNVVHIDSTLTYTEFQEKNDLVIGTWHLQEALNKIDDNKPTIILSHFPIASFSQDERKAVLNLLRNRRITLWLCGHEHDHVLMRYSNLLSIQAGELRREEKTRATILIGEYSPFANTGFISAYTWFPEGWSLYPAIWNDDSCCYQNSFSFHFLSSQISDKVHYFSKKTYKGVTPWDEVFEIKLLDFSDEILTLVWINQFSTGLEDINIEETLQIKLDEYLSGNYEINVKKYIYNDPEEYFWYFYKGKIQLLYDKILITFCLGQRLSYKLHGSGAEGYYYSGAWANAAGLHSILEMLDR